jgi:predicted acylesterase/phospholipase RssA
MQFLERRSFLRLSAAGAGGLALGGCSDGVAREAPVPVSGTTRATVIGLKNERFFPLERTDGLEAEFYAGAELQMKRRGLKSIADLDLQLLAVSGGGEDGAFGAGLLCGWSQQGSRPVFEVVTGVSTGALIAPFAYLGPAYDDKLRYVYTEISAESVLRKRSLMAALLDDAMADNSPLFGLISKMLDAKMLADLASAYEEGRLLLIGTTNLDAQQPVIWNVGAIARSGHPRALDTIRRILLASAAIPGAFPPTMFPVTLDGKSHEEMHVDGGALAQTFLYPAAVTNSRRERIAARRPIARAQAYVIRNGRLDPNWADVRRQTLGIAGRAIFTMLVASGYNDVVRIYLNARRDHIDFNLAYIGRDFDRVVKSPFEQAYMRALFDYGYQRALKGYDWAKAPPRNA